LKDLVLDAVTSPHSRRSYELALDGFIEWWHQEGRPPFTKATVQAFRAKLENDGLASATINVRLSAIRKLAVEAADNGLLDPDLAAGIGRVKGAKRLGVRLGNWLTLQEAKALLAAPDAATVKGRRDRAILAVLLGCALRRSELAGLIVEQIQQRDGRWVVADLVGKGGRVRTVPVPAWVKVAFDAWVNAAAIESGRVWRSINRGGRVWGDGLTEKVIWHVVERYASEAGWRISRLMTYGGPRRSCAGQAAGSWNRSRYCWGTHQCGPPSGTWGRGRILPMRPTIIWGWGEGCAPRARRGGVGRAGHDGGGGVPVGGSSP
jgi:site-specific recombinase XerD